MKMVETTVMVIACIIIMLLFSSMFFSAGRAIERKAHDKKAKQEQLEKLSEEVERNTQAVNAIGNFLSRGHQ